MPQTCRVEGCERLSVRKGYCNGHYRQMLKHGKITSKRIAIRDTTRKCIVDGCDSPYHCKGYCERHYSQIRKHGKIISADRLLGPRVGKRKRDGYVYILKKEHPNADKRGYVKRSWLVWEGHTGHMVTPPEVIHHKNGIRDDDRFENLELLPSLSAHIKEHGGRIGGVRIINKESALKEMKRVYKIIRGPFTTRKFDKHSKISSSVICRKFGWKKMKEELCIP